MSENSLLNISSSPHIRNKRDVSAIMLDVVIALIPSIVASVYFFGLRALLLTTISVATAVVVEYIIGHIILKRETTIGDFSAIITGILLAGNLPVGAPLWLPIIGSFFAIAVVKWTFGGLGNNFVNPALAGRAFLMASYPAFMTGAIYSVAGKFGKLPTTINSMNSVTATSMSNIDGISSATPLVAVHSLINSDYDLQNSFHSLFWGNVGGTIAETSVFAILLGAIWLLYKRVIGFTVPFVYLITLFTFSLLFNEYKGASLVSHDALSYATYMILSGGAMYGAFFMLTDMVTSPITVKGGVIYAFGAGFITFIIRRFGGYPEGVSYSILLMNLVVPLIDRYIKPRVYGTGKL